MDADRINQLTHRIETAGERIVEVLQTVNTALADRAALEVAVVERATPAQAPVIAPLATSAPVHTSRPWLRWLFVSSCALLGAALVSRARRRH